jgi:hypothetical protein
MARRAAEAPTKGPISRANLPAGGGSRLPSALGSELPTCNLMQPQQDPDNL